MAAMWCIEKCTILFIHRVSYPSDWCFCLHCFVDVLLRLRLRQGRSDVHQR